MRRFTSAFVIATLVVAAGCGDQVAPTAATPTGPAPSLSRSGWLSTGAQYSFDISPRGGVYWVGQYLLVVPPNAVCDPATSSYGPGTWDAPCTPAAGPIHITASVTPINGRDYVDFSPDIRFVPSASPSGWVTLHTFRLAAIGGRGDLRRFSILFSDVPGGPIVDESATDPTLATYVNIRTGAVWRRIKHFTGYNVHSGMIDDCTPYVDDGCYPVGTVITTQ
ncbi:MAG: hypothetical protein KGL38_02115 [Gemmatimonadota bacterium]|nr:hypothetical protein [Gemmatimonadota bacterium]